MEEKFENIYNKIYNASNERLKNVRKTTNTFILIVLAVSIVINMLIYLFAEKYMVTITISLSICLLIIFFIYGNQNYRKIYKKCVIEALIKECNPSLNFDPTIGITQREYLASKFDNSFNEYVSEDRVYGNLKAGGRFQFSEVATYSVNRYQDEDGNTVEDKAETYRGMYGIARLENNLGSKIFISSDSMFRRYNKNRIEVDSYEFEKYYDCVSDDKITAMRIFTSELIEKYIDIRKGNRYDFELKIENNVIYFRYKCGQIFEPPTIGMGLDKSLIEKYFNLIYYPLEILEKTVENINSVVKGE